MASVEITAVDVLNAFGLYPVEKCDESTDWNLVYLVENEYGEVVFTLSTKKVYSLEQACRKWVASKLLGEKND